MAVRAVIVGCGAMSRGWLEAAAMIDGLSIVGLVDIDGARARSRADEFDLEGAVTGTDLEAVLTGTKPDVVFDVVVPSARHDVAMTAFAHGCHVLSEKPMADTLDRAKALVRAATEEWPRPRHHPEPPLSRRYSPHPPLRRLRRRRAADEPSL